MMPNMSRPRQGKIEDEIASRLTELLNHYALTIDNKQVSFSHSVSDVHLLNLAVLMKDCFPRLARVQMLRLLRIASTKLKLSQIESDQVKALFDELDRLLGQTGAKRYKITAFLDVPYMDARTSAMVDGVMFSKESTGAPHKFLAEQKITQHIPPGITGTTVLLSSLTPYSYEVDIPNYQVFDGIGYALEELIAPYEKFRSLVNFSHHVHWYQVVSGNSFYPRPEATFFPSPFFFFEDDGNVLSEFFYDSTMLQFGRNNLADEMRESAWYRFDTTQKTIAEIAKPSQASLIWQLLYLYQKALDTTDDSVAFLHLWQILERITSPTQVGRALPTKSLIKRLSYIKKLESADENVLRELGDLRHQFAHSGLFPYENGQYYKRILKNYVDWYLGIIIDASPHKFPTKRHLEEYYNVASDIAPSRISAMQHAINLFSASDHTIIDADSQQQSEDDNDQ